MAIQRMSVNTAISLSKLSNQRGKHVPQAYVLPFTTISTLAVRSSPCSVDRQRVNYGLRHRVQFQDRTLESRLPLDSLENNNN